MTVATTHKEGLVVGMRSLPGNPYDGHTLPEAIEQISILTDHLPKAVFVDKGYRGVEVAGVTIWRSGQKRGVTPAIKKAIHRRSAIEPAIGHMKNEGRLRRSWLKGSLGDAMHAVLCGAGHNLRMILRALRLCFAFLWTMLFEGPTRSNTKNQNPFQLLTAQNALFRIDYLPWSNGPNPVKPLANRKGHILPAPSKPSPCCPLRTRPSGPASARKARHRYRSFC